jgi:hypothetical protein
MQATSTVPPYGSGFRTFRTSIVVEDPPEAVFIHRLADEGGLGTPERSSCKMREGCGG